eukprot:scaffold1223_cov31-Tisochrysis_lutea.AAC.2
MMSQRPHQCFGRTTTSPAPKEWRKPSASLTEPLPLKTRNISVVGRSFGESHPPSVQAHDPTVAPFHLVGRPSLSLARGRVKSCGSPTSTRPP